MGALVTEVPAGADGAAAAPATTGDVAVRTAGLTCRFGDVVAVDGLTLAVQPGEVYGLLGHNGAGKTTTIRLLNGLLAPSAGGAQVLGLDPARQGAALRARTGVLTENPSLEERLSAEQNLVFFGRMYGVPRPVLGTRVPALLEELGLAERAQDRVATYSKGMKQRLALARALLPDPELLFLDEPTAALDPVAARQVHALVEVLRRRARTIVLCTHNLVEAQRLCHRVAVLRRGRLLAEGTPQELGERYGASRVVLEVTPERVPDALEALSRVARMRPQHEPETAGGVRVPAAGRADVPGLLAAVMQAGVPVYRAEAVSADLEDVYYHLMGDVGAE